jgi:putative membrane protein
MPAPGSREAENFGRLHRLTPLAALLRAGAPFVAFLVISTLEQRAGSGDHSGLLTTTIAFGVFALLASAGGAIAVVVTRYRLEAGELRVDSGLLTRNSKRLRLDRLQSVDVREPLAARILGLAELRVVTAGASRESVHLRYLSAPMARELRAELLGRAAGLGPGVAEAPEHPLAVVSPNVLIGSAVLTLFSWRILPVAFVVLGVVGAFSSGKNGSGAHAALFGVVVLLAITIGQILWARINKYWQFTISTSPDGLRLRYGLLNTQVNTVPPGRIQALRLHQPLLWRPFGWAEVQVNVAGSGERRRRDEHVLIPVAPIATAWWLLSTALEGVDVEHMTLTRPPSRARFVAPFWWRAMSAGSDERFFVARHGLFSRSMEVVPHERTQSVHLHAGPLARWLGLASVHLDSTRGPVTIRAAHRDGTEARAMLDTQAERSRRARQVASSSRWMRPEPPFSSGSGTIGTSSGVHPTDLPTDSAATNFAATDSSATDSSETDSSETDSSATDSSAMRTAPDTGPDGDPEPLR